MDITDDEFEEKVIEASKNKLILVDFWAEWCAPCRMLAPIIEKAVKSYGSKIELIKVNVDDNPESSEKYRVDAIPAVKLFKNGKIIEEFIGVVPEESIKKMVERHLSS